jgi:hypothetical protein
MSLNKQFLIMLGVVFALAITGTVVAGSSKCETRCATELTPKMVDCKGEEHCEAYIRYEYRSCVNKCDKE